MQIVCRSLSSFVALQRTGFSRVPAAVWALLAGLLSLGAATHSLAGGYAPRQLNFDVFLDDRPIGYQRFDLQPTPEGLRVETRAEFEVRVLRITAFEYDHRNVETWSGRCLQAIDSRTSSNGKQFRVAGSVAGEGFVVAGTAGDQRLPECVGTFAYWDKRQLLERERLLNSQTGEYVQVQVRRLGRGSLELGERQLGIERYQINGQGVDITLSYAADSGEWVALDSRLESGRTLRYRRNLAEPGEGRSLAAAR